MRSVIGEAAIKRWETRYKNRFALPLDEDKKPKGKARKAPKPYKWKPYALPEIGKIFKGQSFALPGFPELPGLPPRAELPRAGRGFQPTIFWPRELASNYQHVRETPKPERAVQARKSELMRAGFRKKQGWPPAVKDEAQHGLRMMANAEYKTALTGRGGLIDEYAAGRLCGAIGVGFLYRSRLFVIPVKRSAVPGSRRQFGLQALR